MCICLSASVSVSESISLGIYIYLHRYPSHLSIHHIREHLDLWEWRATASARSKRRSAEPRKRGWAGSDFVEARRRHLGSGREALEGSFDMTMCVHIYIYIYVYVNMYLKKYIHIFIYIHAYVCVCVCLQMPYVYMYIQREG